jgi:hypothetical protein
MLRILAVGLALAAAALPAWANDSHGEAHAAPVAPAKSGAPLDASVRVDEFALVERAPVRNGFAQFTIEAVGLLPMPKKRESFTPSEDEHFYTLRRTVERFLRRKENPVGWSRANDAKVTFDQELGRLKGTPDGIAYAVEGELVVRGTSALPLGLAITAPPGDLPLRYSAGLIVADQVVMMKEGLLDAASRNVKWMVALRPSGADAAIPVRAVFALRAEGEDADANRKALSATTALLVSSSDGRPATAERNNDASEYLKPPQVFVKAGQVPGQGGGGGHGAKEEKKAEKKGGH